MSELINGKSFNCILDFSQYNKNDYLKDFDELIDYINLSGQRSTEDNDLKTFAREIRATKTIINSKDIPYTFFKESCNLLFNKILVLLLKQNPDLMLSDSSDFTIKIFIKRIPQRNYYFDYLDSESDDGFAVFNGSAIWFLSNIVFPMHYFKKINSSIIMRYFAHELTHHLDNAKDFFRIDNNNERKIKKLFKERSMQVANYLYASITNLRYEGIADFNARISSDKQDFNIIGIAAYNENLKSLCSMSSKWEAARFYNKNIGFNNLTSSGEYSNGRMICLTIALYVSKLNKENPSLIINNNKIVFNDLKLLDSLMSNHNIVYVSDLSKKSVSESQKLVGQTTIDDFLSLYETACDYLKISEKNRIMTLKRYSNLLNLVKKNSKKI